MKAQIFGVILGLISSGFILWLFWMALVEWGGLRRWNMAKKEKVEIIHCQGCRYYNPISDTLEGVCRVSPFKAYRKHNQYCDSKICSAESER